MNTTSTFGQLRKNEREIRKNLIIDAAIGLFATKSFENTSIRDIAAAAGISPASIYRYFADRDELFVEALLREGKDIIAGMEKLLAENGGSSIEKISAGFVDYLLEHDAFFQMMTHFMLGGNISEKALTRFNQAERYLLNAFEGIFKDMGVKENARLIAHAFFASLNGIVITFRKYPGRSEEEVKRHMRRLAGLIAGIFKKGAV
ncbi:TetR/AcrR family transcriptional regulator [Desulfotomaculum copahuensis]|uniref:TetR family transcriptional regulator n=1 Tax=Desulfotomaculum copahuensis TaxID=1838280 RepID=A0A1B7LFF3_9FIRM|nr:TetR/AcrR family transcriptional regulator [Desulfotomaculum copahuensis]OAT82344.1 TetR family transcriptional regulator [Desulfotomaculum copahuensis]